MTANQTTYAAMLALDEASSHRKEAARLIKGSGQGASGEREDHASRAQGKGSGDAHRVPLMPPDTRQIRPRGLHPGDVIYWVACLGGACLLLILGTT